MIKGKNFMGLEVADIPKDAEYKRCNFARRNCIDDSGVKKGARLFPGDDTPRIFTLCNMSNCEPPPGSTVVNCNCSISAKQVVVGSDTVEIDGESITVYDYANISYGRYKDGEYVYKNPVISPCEGPED